VSADHEAAPAADAAKATLVRYLDAARDSFLWKLEGLSEHDLRRPMTPTGTNLLGMLKHCAYVESGYLGLVFGRPFPEHIPGYAPDDPVNIDMYATAEESEADIRDLWARVRAHGDATIAALDADSPGRVPWWAAERADTDLRTILVHLVAEWNRHGGHADIVSELLGGPVGYRPGNANLPPEDEIDWPAYVAMLQQIADDRP
jgi:uncharacterized damage-inducible protein DinB